MIVVSLVHAINGHVERALSRSVRVMHDYRLISPVANDPPVSALRRRGNIVEHALGAGGLQVAACLAFRVAKFAGDIFHRRT